MSYRWYGPNARETRYNNVYYGACQFRSLYPPPSMEFDIFREKLVLKYPAYGHALWQPNPGKDGLTVEIGDVGFIREGHFHHLFNVLPPKADGPDRGDVPPGHKPFKIRNSESPPTHTSKLRSNHFCSNGVSKRPISLTNM